MYNRYYEKIGNTTTVLSELDDMELPTNWCICRFSTIANIFTGNSINEQEKQKKYYGRLEGFNYIGTKDVAFDHAINYNNGVRSLKIRRCVENILTIYNRFTYKNVYFG